MWYPLRGSEVFLLFIRWLFFQYVLKKYIAQILLLYSLYSEVLYKDYVRLLIKKNLYLFKTQ